MLPLILFPLFIVQDQLMSCWHLNSRVSLLGVCSFLSDLYTSTPHSSYFHVQKRSGPIARDHSRDDGDSINLKYTKSIFSPAFGPGWTETFTIEKSYPVPLICLSSHWQDLSISLNFHYNSILNCNDFACYHLAKKCPKWNYKIFSSNYSSPMILFLCFLLSQQSKTFPWNIW